jgi:hypothetical protein
MENMSDLKELARPLMERVGELMVSGVAGDLDIETLDQVKRYLSCALHHLQRERELKKGKGKK